MCKCTPEIRTPFCGKPGCEWPKPEGVKKPFDGRLRLGFTGAGGSGKTTLAKNVAERLGLTHLPTPITETGARFGMKNFLDHQGQVDAVAYQFAILHGQIYQEKGLQLAGLGYIAERTSLDYIPYWTRKTGLSVPAALNDIYINTAFNWAKDNYTMIIYCPPEFLPTDGDTWKERQPKDQAYTDAVINVCLQNVQAFVPVVKVKGTPEDRFVQVIAALQEYARRTCPTLCGK